MVFSPTDEIKQFRVFISPNLSNAFFNKGQNYLVELESKRRTGGFGGVCFSIQVPTLVG